MEGDNKVTQKKQQHNDDDDGLKLSCATTIATVEHYLRNYNETHNKGDTFYTKQIVILSSSFPIAFSNIIRSNITREIGTNTGLD